MTAYQFRGKVAVVTGAGSGIGRALALALAKRGVRLALSDIDNGSLAETRNLAGKSAEVHASRLDVTDRAGFKAYADSVSRHYGVVHQIFNNAGVGLTRRILDSNYEDYERILAVNLWSVIHGTKEFLPHLIASDDGHVINIASLNGIMAFGGLSHYCTSKFAVRGFTETLRIEMLDAGYPVLVTGVYPGGIKTNIVANSMKAAEALGIPENRKHSRQYDEKLLRLSPDIAAETILDGVSQGDSRILVGRDAKFVDKLIRAFPSSYPKAVVAFRRRVIR